MTISQSDMQSLALKAGLPADAAATAAAIGMAESGGNPNSHNTNASTGDDSYGLWQINMLGALGPARRALYGLKADSDLYNTETNARVMSAMSHQGKDFSPWSTYKSGAYKRFLSTGTPVTATAGAVTNVDFPGGGWDPLNWIGSAAGAISSTDAAADATVKAIESVASWVSTPENWVRVAYVIAGAGVVMLGLVMVLKSTDAGTAAYNVGKKVAVKATETAALA